MLSQKKKVTLSILDPYDPDLNTKGLNYLKSFHLVVLDFVDGGHFFGHRCPMFVRALMQYIKEGGALFSTHDQFDETHSRFIFQEELDMLNADIQKGIDDANAGNISDAFEFLDELKAKYE